MAASNALGRIITQYPTSFYAGSATLLFGQRLGASGAPTKAREVFSTFLNKSPETTLKPELELAIARTYEQETNWAKAVGTYDGWLREYTNHSARPEAMFYYGQALFHVGDETNAYASFTNFLAAYPKHPLAAQAQWSIADRYYQTEAYQKAENDFQLIALNWPGTDLSYEALMMAGRAAYSRQGWNDATNYFERVIKATNCSPELHFSAIFAYADTVMSQVSTNKEADYVKASEYFDKICQQYPTNHLAVLACGERAVCLLQLARSGVGLTNAAQAFSAVLTNDVYADGHAVTVAKVGLGVVFEKQAAVASAPDQSALRYAALDQYLDVLDGRYLKGPEGDEFWTREAAMCGVRLASDMQEWQKVINFCDRIIEKVPSSAPSFEEPRRKAVDNLARGKIAADGFDRQKTSD
jgi:TolA-binding protein